MTMSKLILILIVAAFPALAAAQKPQVKYEIEPAGKDSFYLVETVIRPIAGSARPQELKTPILFRDTTDFVVFVRDMKADFDKREAELKTKADEAAFLAAKIRVIEQRATAAGIKLQ